MKYLYLIQMSKKHGTLLHTLGNQSILMDLMLPT